MPGEGLMQAARARSAYEASQRLTGARRSAPRHRSGVGMTVTERDVVALRWIGEQFAARYDTLSVLLGRLSPGEPHTAGVLGIRTVAQIVERWQGAGLVSRYRLLGRQWVAPTRAGLQLVGLEVPVWSPVVTQLAHVHAVGLVRLAVEAELPERHRWLSERLLRLDGSKGAFADAAVQLPEDEPPATATGAGFLDEAAPVAQRIAVEVELTRKSTGRLREILRRPRPARWVRTVYYAPPHVAAHLRRQIAIVQPAHRFDMFGLPPVTGATYGGSR